MVRKEQTVAQKKIDLKKKRERGASLVEYALLVALVAGAAIGGITLLGQNTQGRFANIAGQIQN